MRLFKLFSASLAGLLIATVCSAQNVKKVGGYVHVYDVESSLPLVKNKYTYENDTIKITYYFWGNKGIVQIGINNKLDKPIYVDWKKSIYKNRQHELNFAPEITITKDNKDMYESYAFEGRFLHSIDYEQNYHSANSNEFATKVEDITEIKPYGYYMRLKYHLLASEIYQFPEDAKKLSEPSFVKEGETETVYESVFPKDKTPFAFTISIVYSDDKECKKETSQVADFYVSRAFELNAKHFRGPKSGKDAEGRAIYKFPYRRSSRFYHEIDKKNAVEERMKKK